MQVNLVTANRPAGGWVGECVHKWETTGRVPDIHSLALSITTSSVATLFLSVFRVRVRDALLHTSFKLFRATPDVVCQAALLSRMSN